MIRTDCEIQKPSRPSGGERLCWNPGCRTMLEGRQRKWCWQHTWAGSWWYLNHSYGRARHWVVMIACARDHHKKTSASYDLRRVPLMICVPTCAHCGKETTSPEVDHIRPMNGDDRQVEDCRHHVENLRVLCHKCHAGVTRRQAFNRAADRRGQGVLINI